MKILEIEREGYSKSSMPTEDYLWEDAQEVVKAIRGNIHDIEMNKITCESNAVMLNDLNDIFGKNIVLDKDQEDGILDLSKSVKSLTDKITEFNRKLNKIEARVISNEVDLEAYKLDFDGLEVQLRQMIFDFNKQKEVNMKVAEAFGLAKKVISFNRIMAAGAMGIAIALTIYIIVNSYA